MTIRNQNFEVCRGDSHTIHTTLTQADGTSFDPTLGAILRWRMTRNLDDEDDAVIRKDLTNGITASPGAIDIALTPGETDVKPGLYYHELKVWDGTDVSTAMEGYVWVRRSARMGQTVISLQGNVAIERKLPTRTP